MQIPDLPELPPEIELVLRLAQPGSPEPRDLQALLHNRLDWEKVRLFARKHSLLPFFYPRLAELADGMVPAAVLAEAQELFRLNMLRSTRLGGHLVRLRQVLEGHGIEFMALRGPLLAEIVYQPVPGVRTFSDLDILVHPQDFPSVYAALGEAGCPPVKLLTEQEQRWIVRGDRDFAFYLGADVLEVHWAVDEPGYCFPLKNSQFWEAKTSHRLLGDDFYTFNPDLFFLSMCLHGARHRWEKLAWAFDLAWFAHSQQDFDWQGFWVWACGLGFRRVAAMGMQMAELVGSARFPDEMRRAYWRENMALRLTHQNLESLLLSGAGRSRSSYKQAMNDLAYDLQARERLAAKVYLVADRLFTPRQSDWRAFRLPERLYWLYTPLRPLRLLWSALKK